MLVVGASSGIGRACALAFAERGARLVLAARNRQRLAAVAEACERSGATAVHVVPTDVLDELSVRTLIDEAVQRCGRIDVAVYCAAVMAYGTIEDLPADAFEHVVDTSVQGTANVARAVLPVMRAHGHGTLIVVTSLLASIPVPQMGAYVVGKWAQLGLARVLQLETRDAPNVNVCIVAPGAVDTPIYERAANFIGRRAGAPPPVDPPEKVARAVVRCADRPRNRLSVGWANRFIILGFRVVPRLFDRLVSPLFQRFSLSDRRTAPTYGNVFDAEYEPDEDDVSRPPTRENVLS